MVVGTLSISTPKWVMNAPERAIDMVKDEKEASGVRRVGREG